jgi:amino acid efflux transporter
MSDPDQMNLDTSAQPAKAGMDRHLTLIPAVALAVTTVIGGGVLALPGTALRQAGSVAFYGWVLAAVITIPLLVVFARLGARYPSAGGVAGFVQAAFGRHAAAGVEVMLVGTFGLGIPAISLSGGSYLAAVFGWSPDVAWVGAIILLMFAGGLLLTGGSVSSRVQSVLATLLIVGLVATGVVGLVNAHAHFHLPALSTTDWSSALAVVGTVFFGFTGWEMVAFTTGEYRNPQRDFPRAVTISFLIVVGVYLLLAAGIQATLSPDDPAAETSPVAALMRTAVSPAAASMVAVLGVVILAANVVGAIWGASRLVYSSASEKLLPQALSVLSGPRRTPRAAILGTLGLFLVVVAASAFGMLSPAWMFLVAGQNFFLLYLLAAVVLARVTPSIAVRMFGVLVTITLTAVVIVGFDLRGLLYPMALFVIGATTSVIARRRHTKVDQRTRAAQVPSNGG